MIDFSKGRNNSTKNLIFESTLKSNFSTEPLDDVDYWEVSALDKAYEPNLDFDIINVMLDLRKIMLAQDELFTDWEVCFLNKLCNNINEGHVDYRVVLDELADETGINSAYRFTRMVDKIKDLITLDKLL